MIWIFSMLYEAFFWCIAVPVTFLVGVAYKLFCKLPGHKKYR